MTGEGAIKPNAHLSMRWIFDPKAKTSAIRTAAAGDVDMWVADKCFARLLLFLPCGVIPIKSLIRFPFALAVLAKEPNLDAHKAVEAPALFFRSFVVEEPLVPLRCANCIGKAS